MSVIESILSAFPLSRQEVADLIRTAPSRYKVHEIKKRNGRGNRTISQPTAEIKIIQKFFEKKYISHLPVSSAAKAYRAGLGISDHASVHAKNRYLLKLDFKDFFPSIRAGDFINHLSKYSNLENQDIKLLSRVFFWRPKGRRLLLLSIGAPSSPAISNTIMFEFDEQLIEYCDQFDIAYTRYADDLALSTNHPGTLAEAHQFVLSLCQEIKSPNLILNREKTVFTSKKYHRQLTGLTLSNEGNASIGRAKKREIRAMAHHYSIGKLRPEELSKLRGWIAFTMSIDLRFVSTIRKLLGKIKFEQLMM